MATKDLKTITFPGINNVYRIPPDVSADITALQNADIAMEEDITGLQNDFYQFEGISDEVKDALLACFRNVAWIGTDGQSYYDDLFSALYPRESTYKVLIGQRYLYNTDANGNHHYALSPLTARAVFNRPIYNDDYTFTIVDTTKYALAGYDFVDNTLQNSDFDGETLPSYLGVSKASAPTWKTSHVATGNYVGMSFKKLDGTDFTSYEAENANGVIFTMRSGTQPFNIINKRAYGGVNDIGNNIKFVRSIDEEDRVARCRFDKPIYNRGYTFTIVDTTKYALAGYDFADDVIMDWYNPNISITEHGYKWVGTDNPVWTTSHVATGNYVGMSFKKLDGTDFTSQEIENANGTIFTYTRRT